MTIESQNIASGQEKERLFGENVTTYILGGNVTCVEPYSFRDLKSLTSIILSNSVKSIKHSAFYNCTNLTDITIPSSVTNVSAFAFEGCTSLPVENNIRYADTWALGVTDKSLIKYTLRENTSGLAGTFEGCTSLEKITLPNSLKYIDRGFYGCSALKSLTLPEGLVCISESSFEACWNLEKINIPSGVTRIEARTFSGCNLKEISIPKDVTEIGYDAFSNNKFTTVELPESLTSIGSGAFRGCPLSSITIPKGVTNIENDVFSPLQTVTLNSPTIASYGDFKNKFGAKMEMFIIAADIEEIKDFAFYNCANLQSVILPESLTKIGESSFEGCSALTDIILPNKVATISDYAFAGCTKLEALTCNNTTPPSCGTGVFEDVNTKDCALNVPKEAIAMYAETAPWSEFNILGAATPDVVNLIDGQLFENDKEMTLNEITYTRTLTKTNTWNALYVPFEIPVTAEFLENYDVAYFNDIHSFDEYIGEKENGVKGKDGVIDRMDMEVLMVQEGATLNANYPYLIRAKNEDALNMNIKVENATLYKAVETTVSCSSVFMKFDVTGIYTTKTSGELKGEFNVYAMSGGGWKQAFNDTQQLKPFRLYLSLTSIDGSPVKVAESAMKHIRIRVDGEEEATGIDEIQTSVDNSAVIYDLQGRRVKKAGKGIYIVNGKKVVMK